MKWSQSPQAYSYSFTVILQLSDLHKIRLHFKHSMSQSVLERCWIRWWRMFRRIFCPQTFLKQFLQLILKFLKICFKSSSYVCEMISASMNSFCCIRVTIFARHQAFFLWKCWKMMIIIWWLSNTHQCRMVLTQALKFFGAFRLLQKFVYKSADCFCTMNFAN